MRHIHKDMRAHSLTGTRTHPIPIQPTIILYGYILNSRTSYLQIEYSYAMRNSIVAIMAFFDHTKQHN